MLLNREPNPVARWGASDAPPKWTSVTTTDLKACLEESPDEQLVDKLFPGPLFFGPFINSASSAEKLFALSVLRLSLTMHSLLVGSFSEPTIADEPYFYEGSELIESYIREDMGFDLLRGEGYTSRLNQGDNTIPKCEIWSLSIPLSESYRAWLAPRVEACNALGKLINSMRFYHLLVGQHCEITGDDNPRLRIVIYASMSLQEKYDAFIEEYEAQENKRALNGYELFAGLLGLADALATIHLCGAMPWVTAGILEGTSELDSLTDLWMKCYDKQESGFINTGSCEVCGRLYASGNLRMRGHAPCMNRQRVMHSRARKYKALLDSGVEKKEASKRAKISSEKAESILVRQ